MTKQANTIASFTKRFELMHSTGLKAAELIQQIGLEVLEHFKMHDDATLVNAYFKALPPGVNYKAMTAWLTTFAAVRVNTLEATKDAEPFKNAKGKATDVDGAKAMPWFKMLGADVPKAAQVFDIKARMVSMVKQAAKAEKLEGDFHALRKAAIAMGVAANELPTDTDANLKAKEAATGQTIAKTTKENTKASKGAQAQAAALADPLLDSLPA